jgi:hypothetical protein
MGSYHINFTLGNESLQIEDINHKVAILLQLLEPVILGCYSIPDPLAVRAAICDKLP